MKFPGPLKHLVFAFVIALVLYVSFYRAIEHRRTRNGPWQVAFTNAFGAPVRKRGYSRPRSPTA